MLNRLDHHAHNAAVYPLRHRSSLRDSNFAMMQYKGALMLIRSGLRGVKDILGYGGGLLGGLTRIASSSDESVKREVRKEFCAWMSDCPHADHICFVDLTAFIEERLAKPKAVTLVLTHSNYPEERNLRKYLSILKDRYLTLNRSMAFNPDFTRGLPVRKTDTRYEMLDVRSLRKLIEAGTSTQIENGYFVTKILEIEERDQENHAKAQFVAEEKITDRVEGADKSEILDLWEKWISEWRKVASECPQTMDVARAPLSQLGGTPSTILAIPIGYRNPADLREFTLTAYAFLGFDRYLKWEFVQDVVRYILIYLYAADATPKAFRQAIEREELLEQDYYGSFAHEIKDLIAGIHIHEDECDAGRKTLREIREYFHMLVVTSGDFKNHDDEELWSIIDGKFPVGFGNGRLWRDFVQNHLAIAGRMNALVDRLRVDGEDETLPTCRHEGDDRAVSWEYMGSLDRPPQRLRELYFFCVALVAAFRNVMKFLRGSPREIIICFHDDVIELRNVYESEDRNNGTLAALEKPFGTAKTLRTYVRHYRPQMESSATFTTDEEKKYWITILPLPAGFLSA